MVPDVVVSIPQGFIMYLCSLLFDHGFGFYRGYVLIRYGVYFSFVLGSRQVLYKVKRILVF